MSQQFAKPRLFSRTVGIVIMLISVAVMSLLFTRSAQRIPMLAFIAPVFMMMGLSLIIKPNHKPENKYLYGTSQIPWRHLPLLTKGRIVVGAIFSLTLFLLFADFYGLSAVHKKAISDNSFFYDYSNITL